MERLELLEVNESKVIYKYYPNRKLKILVSFLSIGKPVSIRSKNYSTTTGKCMRFMLAANWNVT